ncbi:PIR Superfamily Protein [Plasmodium ovale wallikeri]|uniref:PIR Superfamily Protein n=1 Tax=Plasmodium ovale wallikeri TaxID=864142 RepID=A0A1A9AQH1_PLAOA|nr:PIR Superfamily Protein [Plasmodium ovale wallikeri]SBT58935.1 PIR Superfamily Protein [Plasmodium ovale wallikeri]
MTSFRQIEWEDEFKNLSGYDKYKELDREINEGDYKSDCQKLQNEVKSVNTLCRMMVRNLTDLSKILDRDEQKVSCYYLQHWIHDRIRRILNKESNYTNKDAILGKLREIAQNINNRVLRFNPCSCLFANTFDEWKQEKDLHDYFKIFDSIKCSNTNKHKCQNYYNFVKYIKELYEDEDIGYMNCCEYGFLEDFCMHYFNCDENAKPNNILINLESDLDRLNKIEDVLQQNVKQENTVINGTSNPNDFKLKNGLSQANNEETPSETISTRLIVQDAVDQSTILTQNSHVSEFPFRTVLFITSIIGTIIFFIYYFRFRTCGYKLRKKSRKKKRYENYLYEEKEQELSADGFESVYIYTPSNRLYMTYHQSRNTEIIPHTVHYNVE